MAKRQKKELNLPKIDLQELLHGSPMWEDVVEFFRKGEFHEEHYLVAAIKRHLLTLAHRSFMHEGEFSIEDMLNGRVPGGIQTMVTNAIFEEWNEKLGFRKFGF